MELVDRDILGTVWRCIQIGFGLAIGWWLWNLLVAAFKKAFSG